MQAVFAVIFVTGAVPLWIAWLANRRTALAHALAWGTVAWLAWCWAGFIGFADLNGRADLGRYIALCLTGCAGVAVLGARRPGVAAWNFVVLGLLAVMLLPLADQFRTGGELRLDPIRAILVGSVIAVGVLNYLPTKLAPAAVLLAAVAIVEIMSLCGAGWFADRFPRVYATVHIALALVPWLAFWQVWHRPRMGSEFDRLWLAFRDRFGLVWAQRLREQFNQSARHAGWNVFLSWRGLRRTPGAPPIDPDVRLAMMATLCALMKRFGERS